ncbi:hypothetical protein OIU78_005508 [Salix suchowensis]|nr:hypothetical protein OIU78_005508 [Salix suchowensis]
MRLELQPFKLVTDVAVPPSSTLDITPANRQKVELFPIPFSQEETWKTPFRYNRRLLLKNTSFFGVFDGHGCSHVAMKCRDRLHEIVNEEVEGFKEEKPVEWEETMKRSFIKMDKEVESCCVEGDNSSNCRLLSRIAAILVQCFVETVSLFLSHRITSLIDQMNCFGYKNAGGRVIYWDGARVLGVLAMSRAIGDNYLKPFVIPEPDVTLTERTGEDECLILASDGLWDVVSNDTACGVVRMCLRARTPPSPPGSPGSDAAAARAATESSDKACSDASILLTKLALARNSSDNVSVVVVDLRRNHQ